jgi:prenyl protein peptidase
MSNLIGPLLCIVISIVFVSSLYVWGSHLDRDHPTVIQQRIVSVLISSAIAVLTTTIFTGDFEISTEFSSLHFTVLQTLALMFGPIYDQISWCDSPIDLVPSISFMSLRNLIVAPICEEIVFRECFFQILKFAQYSNFYTALMAPCLFAFAHAHHYRTSLPVLAGRIAHTCIFGWLAFYFLIRGSLIDCIVSHFLCNAIGLPKESKTKKRSVMPYIAGLSVFSISILTT